MFAVVGAHGKTGSAVIRCLLDRGKQVRAIVRDRTRADALPDGAVETVVGDVADVETLARAFDGAEAVYALNPPAYMEADLFARARAVHAALIRAAEIAGVGRLVALSSVGAQHAAGTGNILTTHDFETQLAASRLATVILRAANFLDNWGWMLQPAYQNGVLPSMLHPLHRRIPSVAARDVGEAAARLMVDGGPHIVELQGPDEYSPNDAAEALGMILGRPVQPIAVPEGDWIDVFQRQGMPARSARAFADMYRGFNSGLIAFEGVHEMRRGATGLKDALTAMVSMSQIQERSDETQPRQ